MALSFEQFKELRQKGLSNDQIIKFESGQTPEQPKQEGGFFSNVGSSLLERGKNIVNEMKPQEQSMGQGIINAITGKKAVNVLGNVAGGAMDVVGEGAKSAYKTLVPEQTRESIKQHAVDVLQTPAGQAGLNALKSGVDVYKKFEEANPETAKYLGNVLNIASIIPVGKGASVVGKEGLAIAEDTGKIVGKVADKISSKNTVEEALGQILQGETKDISKGFQALKSLDLKGVSKFQELDKKIGEKIKTLASEVDTHLAQDPTIKKLGELSTQIKTKAGALVSTNYAERGLNHLKELYGKIGDVAKKADIKDLITKAKTQGLTRLEINNIAREYGQEFGGKAFSKMGDALTSVNAQMFENTRKGLKTIAREGITGMEAKAKDQLMSNLYNTQRLVQKNLEAVNKLAQKAEKMGLGRQALRGIMKTADVITLGGFRAVRETLIQSNIGRKTMNFLDVEGALKKNLKIIEEAGTKIEGGWKPKSKLFNIKPGMTIKDVSQGSVKGANTKIGLDMQNATAKEGVSYFRDHVRSGLKNYLKDAESKLKNTPTPDAMVAVQKRIDKIKLAIKRVEDEKTPMNALQELAQQLKLKGFLK